MKYTTERRDDIKACVIHIEGDIDVAVVPEVRRSLDSLLESGIENIIIDLHSVAYADSSALGLLVWLDARLLSMGGRIVLSGANRDVMRILEISGLVSVARTVSSAESVEDALGGFVDSSYAATLLWSEDLDVVADVEKLSGIRERVCEILQPLDLNEAALFDVKVALGEALANAVRHGSPDSESVIQITVDAYDDRIVLHVRDTGCGFDGEHSCNEDLYAASGRGVMFMRALMDQVEFEQVDDGGTVVSLMKHRTAIGSV